MLPTFDPSAACLVVECTQVGEDRALQAAAGTCGALWPTRVLVAAVAVNRLLQGCSVRELAAEARVAAAMMRAKASPADGRPQVLPSASLK